MGGRSLLIIIIGIFVISSLALQRMNQSLLEQSSEADSNFLRQSAANIALGGVKLGLRQLADNELWRGGFSNMKLSGGRVTVSIVDSVFDGDAVVIVRGTGIAGYGTAEQVIKTKEAIVRLTTVPGPLRAAITVRNPVKINGLFVVDGRDHTPGGALIAASGVAGIYSTSTIAQQGGSTIGGTAGGIDYAPANPGDPAVVQPMQAYPGGYPGTPDSVMGGAKYGFPEGTLKSIAQSGGGGSQYVTDASLISWPVSGVTYVELPSGGVMPDKDINGSGILVVHNSAGNALLRNVKSGTFSGLIIADDIDGFKISMVGALFCLTPTPSASQVIGTAQGSLLFSRQAVELTIEETQKRNPKKQETVALGGSELNVIAWRE